MTFLLYKKTTGCVPVVLKGVSYAWKEYPLLVE